MKHFFTFLAYFVPVCFSLLIFPCSSAQAISIKNLDKVPHQFAISEAGGEPYVIEVKPRGIYRTYGPEATVRLLDGNRPGDEVRGRWRDEFAVWPGGDFGIQKRGWPQGRRF